MATWKVDSETRGDIVTKGIEIGMWYTGDPFNTSREFVKMVIFTENKNSV